MDKQLLHTYFAGETTPEEEKKIIDWASVSSENYNEYLQERKWWNAILVNYDSCSPVKTTRRKKTVNYWLLTTAAATIALLFTLTHILFPKDTDEDKWHSVWVPSGQRAQVTLDDGTKVWLNSQSTLSYPVSFKDEKRIVRLNGEGYFEVEKQDETPFVVETKNYNIQVLGTSFNVFAYDSFNLFETSLLSGSVMIEDRDGSYPPVTLGLNEKVSDMDGILQVTNITYYDHFRWKEGLICLDDERFEDLAKKFSLYFDIEITIENPKLRDYRCTGKFRQSDGVDYALRVLQTEMKFTYTRNNESNEIVIN